MNAGARIGNRQHSAGRTPHPELKRDGVDDAALRRTVEDDTLSLARPAQPSTATYEFR